jgi:hypothetical protein
MNLDDPKLTAYALDELGEIERQGIARAVNTSPEAQHEIQETQTMARLLRTEFAAELEHSAVTAKPLSANLSDIRDDPWFWTRARPLAIAAVLAVFAVIGLAFFGSYQLRRHEIAQAGRRDTEPLSRSSTIEAEVEAAAATPSSYAIVRRSINEGVLPPKDSVRIEEMINYFPYDYPEPTREQLLSLDVEVASCPWADSHRLVRIGLKGRKTASSEAETGEAPTRKIAKEVQIQVEFNPAEVASYHLIGYEQQMPGKESLNHDEIDAGEIEAGRTVTALYEVVPAGTSENPVASVPPVDPLNYGSYSSQSSREPNEMLTVKLRYKKSDGDKNELIERAVVDDGMQFARTSPDFKFAAAVAEFGMLLRESEYKGNGTLGTVLEWAEEGKGVDANGYRTGFVELVRKAQTLTRG